MIVYKIYSYSVQDIIKIIEFVDYINRLLV